MGKYLLSGIDPCLFLLGILHGAKVICSFDLLFIGIRIKAGYNEGKDHDYDDHNKTDHRHFIFAEAACAVLPKAYAFPHDYLALLFFFCSRKKIFRL